SGLEYLPESVREFNCLANKRLRAKVKVLCKLLANEQGGLETESGYVKNFSQKLKEYKQKLIQEKSQGLAKGELQVQELKNQLAKLYTENNYLQGQLNK